MLVGGQTSIGIVRYVVFRGLDRDLWNAAGTVFVLIGVLAASAIMIGLVVYSTGFLFKDRKLTFWGCGVVLVSLILVVLAARPVASIMLFGLAALPHIGWWLMLIHAALTLWLASQWVTTVPTQEGSQSAHRRRGWRPAKASTAATVGRSLYRTMTQTAAQWSTQDFPACRYITSGYRAFDS